jgi:hypothetical protein
VDECAVVLVEARPIEFREGLVGPFHRVGLLLELCWWGVGRVARRLCLCQWTQPSVTRIKFGPVLAVHALGQGVVVEVADGAIEVIASLRASRSL